MTKNVSFNYLELFFSLSKIGIITLNPDPNLMHLDP